MNEAEKLLVKLGDRGKEYFAEYVKIKREGNLEKFVEQFGLYLQSQPVGKDGKKTISKFSFRNFLLGIKFE
jgi:hypothetical protein